MNATQSVLGIDLQNPYEVQSESPVQPATGLVLEYLVDKPWYTRIQEQGTRMDPCGACTMGKMLPDRSSNSCPRVLSTKENGIPLPGFITA